MSDHRAEATQWFESASEEHNPGDAAVCALIGIGHALLALRDRTSGPEIGLGTPRSPEVVLVDPYTRCGAYNGAERCLDHVGHAGGHQWPVTCPHGVRIDNHDGTARCARCGDLAPFRAERRE